MTLAQPHLAKRTLLLCAGFACTFAAISCQPSEEPLLVQQAVSQLKVAGWSYIESSKIEAGKTEHWLRIARSPSGTNVDLYVATDKPPSDQYIESLTLNIWSEPRTSTIAINKAASIATAKLTSVVPDIDSLVDAARNSRRQEMNEGVSKPIRWVGRAISRSGWKAELIEYTDHPPGDSPRQQFSLYLRFEG